MRDILLITIKSKTAEIKSFEKKDKWVQNKSVYISVSYMK